MHRRNKTLAIVAAAVVAGAVAVGTALATTGSGTPKEAAAAFVHDVATRLGVSDEKLTTALKEASAARVDQALKDGEITKAQADELKARIESGDAPLLGGPRFGHGGGFGHHGARIDILDTAATYLGKTEAELRAALASGKSLADVAKSAGKTSSGLKDAIAAATKSELDKRVAAGDLTAGRAKTMLERMTSRLDELIAGTLPAMGGRGHHGFGGPGPMGSGPMGAGPMGAGPMGAGPMGGMGPGHMGGSSSFAPAAARTA